MYEQQVDQQALGAGGTHTFDLNGETQAKDRRFILRAVDTSNGQSVGIHVELSSEAAGAVGDTGLPVCADGPWCFEADALASTGDGGDTWLRYVKVRAMVANTLVSLSRRMSRGGAA